MARQLRWSRGAIVVALALIAVWSVLEDSWQITAVADVAAENDMHMNLDDEEFELPEALNDVDEEDVVQEEGGERPARTEPEMPPVYYTKPSVEGLTFAETFDDQWLNTWTISAMPKFTGVWRRMKRMKEAIIDDFGLRVMDRAKHHGIAARFPKIQTTKNKGLIVSYEAKFEDGMTCGGAYLKIFDSKGMEMSKFDNETPYVIMFGPDKCGATDKVHVIIKSRNPISNEWSEHHLKNPPGVPYGKGTHLYTLRISSDDTYEVLVDGDSKRKGNMHSDFEPPFTPPTEIDDPEDKKPADWVDDKLMPDPDAKKPDEWDEDAPRMIEDPAAKMPEGWLVDAPQEIADPNAEKPADWQDDEDGEWNAPMVSNPDCTVGCGPWSPPMISNPDYKGPWTAPMITNPLYKGPWYPRKIPNPEYYEHEHPHELSGSPIDSVGFELWTMDGGMLFDNIIVAQDWPATAKFIDATYQVRHKIEASQTSESDDADLSASKVGASNELLGRLYDAAVERPLVAGGVTIMGLLFVIWLSVRTVSLLKRTKAVSQPAKQSAEKPDTTEKAKEDAAEDSTTAVKSAEEEQTSSKARRRGGRPAPAD